MDSDQWTQVITTREPSVSINGEACTQFIYAVSVTVDGVESDKVETVEAVVINAMETELPVMIVENTTLRDSALATLGVHSMYYWMFAVNFVIYMLTLSDFRKLYTELLLEIWQNIKLFSAREIYKVTQ